MTHAQSFSHGAERFENETEAEEVRIRTCHEQLRFLRSVFHSDVQWEVYACDSCAVEVYTVRGDIHWWNYEAIPKGATQ